MICGGVIQKKTKGKYGAVETDSREREREGWRVSSSAKHKRKTRGGKRAQHALRSDTNKNNRMADAYILVEMPPGEFSQSLRSLLKNHGRGY